MAAKIGYRFGVCPSCGKKYGGLKPTDSTVCDCWELCPKGHRMQPFSVDATPQTYKPIESTAALGDVQHPLRIVMWCPICQYYSAQKPVEVKLT